MNCPKCGKPLVNKGKSPNGGIIYVAEDMEVSTESFDWGIEWWECTACGTSAYISEKEQGDDAETSNDFLIGWLAKWQEASGGVHINFGAAVLRARSRDEAEGAIRRVIKELFPTARIELSIQGDLRICDAKTLRWCSDKEQRRME